MFTITGYSVELVKDPFGILSGKRYEFILDIEVEEDDELYSEQGLYVRVIYGVDGGQASIVKHEIFERTTERLLDFELEDDELDVVKAFCEEHVGEAE